MFTDHPDYAIAVFAYNEENSIDACIESIMANSDERLKEIVVLANGCTDRTADKVRAISESNTKVKLVNIPLGDKCNAWNEYVHHHAKSDYPVHFFTDGDVRFGGNAFTKLSTQLFNNPAANAAAGVPLSGRHRKQYLKLVKERFCLFGGCHALKYDFIQTIRSLNFYLPLGLMWIDSAITKAVNSDLKNQQIGHEDRIIHDASCGYTFDSISPFSWSDIKLYFSRITRYQAGKLQEKHLEKISFADWPRTMRDVNKIILSDINDRNIKLSFPLRRAVLRKLTKLIHKYDN